MAGDESSVDQSSVLLLAWRISRCACRLSKSPNYDVLAPNPEFFLAATMAEAKHMTHHIFNT